MQAELKVALEAVARASGLAMRVRFPGASGAVAATASATTTPALPATKLSADSQLAKSDGSPVTVADFSAQAVVNWFLQRNFPGDGIVGEEDAADLRAHASLRGQVLHWTNEALAGVVGASPLTEETLLSLIDVGTHKGGATGRFWALDPIDGTKGYVRGEQFAVCLALVQDGQVQLGVLGCPNLKLPGDSNVAASAATSKGVLFAAVRGQGAFHVPLDLYADAAKRTTIRVSSKTAVADARFCESVESGHSSHSQSAQIAQRLGITAEPTRMDSQCKYGVLAHGHAADIYLRLPVKRDYQEKIWDHAAGDLIVREAGGAVTDIDGQPLDFSHGRTLARNRGVVATNARIHGEVLAAVREVLEGGKASTL